MKRGLLVCNALPQVWVSKLKNIYHIFNVKNKSAKRTNFCMFTCLDVRTVKAKREKQLRISLNGTNIQGQFSVSSLKDKVEIFKVRSEEWVITNAF